VRQAQRIAVMNSAALVVSFTVKYKDESGKDGLSPSSENFPVLQRASVDMAKVRGIYPGAKMKPHITAMAAGEQDGPEIEFAPNELTAVYDVTGTAGSYKVELI
jgi:hypothetical protein